MGHANLRFWKAWETPEEEHRRSDDFDSSKRTLIVTGKVEVETSAKPMLEEHTKLNGKPKTLYLKFRALEEGRSWKPVWFQKDIKAGDYDEIQLLTPDENAATGGRLVVE